MPNVFDWDDAEETKKFEKDIIFGTGNEGDTTHKDFMKKSMVAANMNIGAVDVEEGSAQMANHRQSQLRFSKTDVNFHKSVDKDDVSASKKHSSPGFSVRGHVNTTTATRPTFESNKKDVRISLKKESEDSIDDIVQRAPQISAADYKRLQDELSAARKTIDSLKHQKWNSIPVNETVLRIVTSQPYTLDAYKSMTEKKGLLDGAVKCGDGNAIITVVIFLERTLSSRIFQQELKKCTTALNHYVQHLRRMEEWRKLEQFYKDMSLIEDFFMLRYERINKITDIEERIVELQKWLNEYDELVSITERTELDDIKLYILDEIKLLEKQRQMENEDKGKEQSNLVMQRFPRSTVELRPLITTITYCALYHNDKGHKFHAEELKKVFQVTDKQYEWAVITPLARLQRWTDIQELLTSTKWFGSKRSDFSHIGFENVVKILHKTKANQDILMKYANLISNQETRVNCGKELSLHDVVIDALFQLKDRQRLEQYRTMIGDTSRVHQQKINDILHNSSIKWR